MIRVMPLFKKGGDVAILLSSSELVVDTMLTNGFAPIWYGTQK